MPRPISSFYSFYAHHELGHYFVLGDDYILVGHEGLPTCVVALESARESTAQAQSNHTRDQCALASGASGHQSKAAVHDSSPSGLLI